MQIAPTLPLAALAFSLVLPAAHSTADTFRVRESLDDDWRFAKGDPADADANLDYAVAKPGDLPTQNEFTVADKNGQLVPRSKDHIQFEIAGPGEIVAWDNGDATSLKPFQVKERNAYNGLVLVIVRATQPGKITLKVRSGGLKTSTTQITALP